MAFNGPAADVPAVMLVNVMVPLLPALMETAVPVVVVMLRAVTLMPVTATPVIADATPVLISMPLTVTEFASVREPLSVGVFAALPGTTRIPAPTFNVAPAPMNCWLDSIAYAPVVGPEPFET